MSYPTLPASVSGSSKLPIPRLHKQRSEPPRKAPVNRQNRVSRACLSCRSRKIKCNGKQPRCSNCNENATSCVYASSRKDRLKTATTQNQDMIALLRELRQQVSSERRARIDDLLGSVVEDVADAAATVQDPIDKYREPIFDDDRGETNVSAEVVSSGEPDLLDEDVTQDEETRATSLIGNAYEIRWLRKMHGKSASIASEEGLWGPPRHEDEPVDDWIAFSQGKQDGPTIPNVKTATFYLDDEVLETELLVDPFEMPSLEIAERLLQAYMKNAHNFFPILAKKSFVNRFYHYYASLQRGNPYNVTRKWRATLNLVFAIGAVYSHLVMADWRADDRDHLTYHSRAWALTARDPWWFAYPDLPHMQITGLLSFYCLIRGRVNRAWVLVGTALRSGLALGLHLRNKDGSTSTARKELDSRIWWAHYSLEQIVSALTGRPSLSIGDLCSVPLPLPLSSEDVEESIIDSQFGDKGKQPVMAQKYPKSSKAMEFSAQQNLNHHPTDSSSPNSGSYLKIMVNLGKITQAALSLYGADTVRESWDSIQRTIAHQNDALDAWATALPEGLNFFHRPNAAGDRYIREQNTLNLMYHSTKMLITRPCLCRLDRRIPKQTAASDTFNQRAALLCVDAANSIAKLLPDATESNLVILYQAGPWWQMVPVIMQALVMLLLEIVLEAKYFPDDRLNVILPLKKLLRWLRIMRVNNGMAVRAYSLALALITKLASTIQFDIRDLISEDEAMTSPVGPSPGQSAPSQTHTPYPDVLNPVNEPQCPTATSAMMRNPQQQQQTQQWRRQHAHEVLVGSQYSLIPSESQNTQSDPPTVPFHLPPSYADNALETDLNVYDNLFLTSSGFKRVMFPGWFVTSFDEHDFFFGTDFQQANFGVQEKCLDNRDKERIDQNQSRTARHEWGY